MELRNILVLFVSAATACDENFKLELYVHWISSLTINPKYRTMRARLDAQGLIDTTDVWTLTLRKQDGIGGIQIADLRYMVGLRSLDELVVNPRGGFKVQCYGTDQEMTGHKL